MTLQPAQSSSASADNRSDAPAAAYCPQCGSPFAPASIVCVLCDRVASMRRAAVEPHDLGRRSLRSALGLYFFLLATSALGLIASAFVGEDDLSTALVIEWSVLAIDAAAVLIWVAASWNLMKPALTTLGNPLWLLAAAAGGGFTFILVSLIMRAMTNVIGIEELTYTEPLEQAGLGFAVAVLTVCVQPAIIEELAFRGVIFASLARIMPAVQAVGVSSVLFMVLHLSPLAFPHLLLLGLILGGLRVASGSIYPGIVLHFVHNLLCIVDERHPIF